MQKKRFANPARFAVRPRAPASDAEQIRKRLNMSINGTWSTLPEKYHATMIAILLAGTVSSGCAMRRSATFLPVDEVQRIRVSQNVDGRQVGDVCVVDDPAQIAQIYAFLKTHEKGWEPLWGTPSAGDYSILLEADDAWQSIFIAANSLQTHSGGAPVIRKLSPESHRELLALLGIEPQASSGSSTAVLPASHAQGA